MPKAFRSVANATVDSNGNASFAFEQVSNGSVWQGSIIIPNAISSSVIPVLWIATDLGLPNTSLGYQIGGFYNNLASGSLQVVNRLTVNGSGLAAGNLQALFQGIVYTPQETPPPWWPEPTPAPPPTSPLVLASSKILTAISAGSTLTFVNRIPVVVGTSLLVSAQTGAPARLQLQWGDPSGLFSPTLPFDINGVMIGWIVPNLDTTLSVSIAAPLSTPSSGAVRVFTGFPPIIEDPLIPGFANIGVAGKILYSAAGTLAASAITAQLQAYTGPAFLHFIPNNTAGFGVSITGIDFNGNTVAQAYGNEQGWAAGTGPFHSGEIIYIPPTINTLTISGPNGTSYSVTLIAM